ncbi:MAG: hypothetical protein IJW33_00110 [Lentisphaeria bacterium]|nr:hypothetical protein [Lentisphaeria bacterium]
MKKFAFFLCAALFCGCVEIHYDGKTAEPRNDDVQTVVFSSPEKVTRKYTVLGEASASGNYQEVSRDRLIAKLREKAAASGADAIIITEQQVISNGRNGGKSSAVRNVFSTDHGPDSWQPVADSVDRDYINTDRSRSTVSSANNSGYTRIIKAQFIRY